MMRLNKEFKLNSSNNIKLKYGCVNKNDPRVIYISARMWICPTYSGNFEESINFVYYKFKKELTKILRNSSIFESKHILDFDINVDNLEKDKKKFFSISFFVKQRANILSDLKSIKNLILSSFGYLFIDLENDLIENDFEVSKTK